VSVHGGDVFFTARRWPEPVRRGLSAAKLVLANSSGVAELSRAAGGGDVRVLRLGTDIPGEVVRGDGRTVVTVGHLVARKRHDEVIRALPPGARYEIVGDGPERARLEALARETGKEVVFHGQLPHEEALGVARRCDVFAMPSTDEAFGVAYVEAMAGGLPAIGLAGEPGPEEIASLGGGMLLTRTMDLCDTIERALAERDALGGAARETVMRHFTWEGTGRATVAAYEEALR
jgi:teichuronic acid biosynthesis glycosyltransferase TuaC